MDIVFFDTNAFGPFLGGEENIVEQVRLAEEIHLSLIVYAELVAGFQRGAREKENRADLETFRGKRKVKLTVPTRRTAEFYAQVKNSLRAKGRPIPVHDIWIAAQCLEHGAVLLTRDSHFDHVEGLRRKGF